MRKIRKERSSLLIGFQSLHRIEGSAIDLSFHTRSKAIFTLFHCPNSFLLMSLSR